MRLFYTLIAAALVLVACKKDTNKSALSLLQHQWFVASESTVIPFCTPYDRFTYQGKPGEYLWFRTDDSVKIVRLGNVLLPGSSFTGTAKYWLPNDMQLVVYNTIRQGNDTMAIMKLTTDSLVIGSAITYSIQNLCINSVIKGVAIDTLRLYR